MRFAQGTIVQTYKYVKGDMIADCIKADTIAVYTRAVAIADYARVDVIVVWGTTRRKTT